jgi:hypothetical protein
MWNIYAWPLLLGANPAYNQTMDPWLDSAAAPQNRSLPTLICARIAAMARVEGRLCGLRADVVAGALVSWSGTGDPLTKRKSWADLSEALGAGLNFHFEKALSRFISHAQPKAFVHHTTPVDADIARQAMSALSGRAFALFFCASPPDSAWSTPSLDERHLNFDTRAQALLAMEQSLGSAMDSLGVHGARLGLRLLEGDFLHIQPELRFDCAPSMPNVPFTAISQSSRGPSPEFWRSLCDRHGAAIESESIAKAMEPVGPILGAPNPRRLAL